MSENQSLFQRSRATLNNIVKGTPLDRELHTPDFKASFTKAKDILSKVDLKGAKLSLVQAKQILQSNMPRLSPKAVQTLALAALGLGISATQVNATDLVPATQTDQLSVLKGVEIKGFQAPVEVKTATNKVINHETKLSSTPKVAEVVFNTDYPDPKPPTTDQVKFGTGAGNPVTLKQNSERKANRIEAAAQSQLSASQLYTGVGGGELVQETTGGRATPDLQKKLSDLDGRLKSSATKTQETKATLPATNPTPVEIARQLSLKNKGASTPLGALRQELLAKRANEKLNAVPAVTAPKPDLIQSATEFRSLNLGAGLPDAVTLGNAGNTYTPEAAAKLEKEIKLSREQTVVSIKDIAINGVQPGKEDVIVFDGKTAKQIDTLLKGDPELKEKIRNADTRLLITELKHSVTTSVNFSWSNLLIAFGKPTISGSGRYSEESTIAAVAQITLKGEDPTLLGLGQQLNKAFGIIPALSLEKGKIVSTQSKDGVTVNIPGNLLVKASLVGNKLYIDVDKTPGNPLGQIIITDSKTINQFRRGENLAVGLATSNQAIGNIAYSDGTTGNLSLGEFNNIITTKSGLMKILTDKNPNIKSQSLFRFLSQPAGGFIVKDVDKFLSVASANQILATIKDPLVDPITKNQILLRYAEQLKKSDTGIRSQLNPESKGLQEVYIKGLLPSSIKSGDVIDLSSVTVTIDQAQDTVDALRAKHSKAAQLIADKYQRFLNSSFTQLKNPNATLLDISNAYKAALEELGQSSVTGMSKMQVESELKDALAQVSGSLRSSDHVSSTTSNIGLGISGITGTFKAQESYKNPLFTKENSIIADQVSMQKAITKVSTTLGFIKLNGTSINPQLATTIVQTLATAGKLPLWIFGATRTYESSQSKGGINLDSSGSKIDQLSQFDKYLQLLVKYQAGDYKVGQSITGADGKAYPVQSIQAFETSLTQSIVSFKMDKDTSGKTSGVVKNMYNIATLTTSISTPIDKLDLSNPAKDAVRAILQPIVTNWEDSTKSLNLRATRDPGFLGSENVRKISGTKAAELGLFVSLGSVGGAGTSSEFSGGGLATTGFLTFDQTKNGSSSEFFISEKSYQTLLQIKAGTYKGDAKTLRLAMAQCFNGSIVTPLTGVYQFRFNASTSGTESVLFKNGYGSTNIFDQQFSGAAGFNPRITQPRRTNDTPPPKKEPLRLSGDKAPVESTPVVGAPGPVTTPKPPASITNPTGVGMSTPISTSPGAPSVPNTGGVSTGLNQVNLGSPVPVIPVGGQVPSLNGSGLNLAPTVTPIHVGLPSIIPGQPPILLPIDPSIIRGVQVIDVAPTFVNQLPPFIPLKPQ
ncbi:MAG: hypothetical protein H7230_02590 [Candidatus Parcubacteria bacterium]|nr:hypothetical protein [Candidatus Paceibacterota bacterium]